MTDMDLLLPPDFDRDKLKWATVTDDSPLTIRIDGDTGPMLGIPGTLVGPLSVADRVLVVLIINDTPQRKYRRAIIMGKAYGVQSVLAALEARIAALEADVAVLETGPNCKTFAAFSAGETTSSTSFADLAGASLSITKRVAASKFHVLLHAQFVTPATSRGAEFAVRIDGAGSDYLVAPMHQAVAAANARLLTSGVAEIPSIAAGARTVQVRWRALAGSGTLVRNVGDDLIAFTVTEVTG